MNLKQLANIAAVTAALSVSPLVLATSELTSAIQKGDVATVRTLLRNKADANAHERDGTTPLQWAVYDENAPMVDALIKAKADVNAANREGMLPLALAAETGNAEIVKMLIDAGAGVNTTLPNGETPLMMAARTGNTASLQLLLQHGADINAVEKLRGTTALMWAAANRNAAAVKLLLKNGANFKLAAIGTNEGRSNPYLAPTARERLREFYQHSGISKALEKPKELQGKDEKSAELIQTELVQRLPADLIRDFMEEDAKKLAARTSNGAKQQEDFLNIPAARKPGQKMKRGGLTALHFAVRENDPDSAAALIEAGADVNQVSEFGWTPLLTATQNRFYTLGKYLLEHGANPNIATEGGWNPLYIATDNRNIEGGDYPTRKPDMDHLEFIKLLLAAGADPNLRMNSSTETRTIFTHQWLEEEGATPFLRAAQSSDVELMKLLLQYGANPNINTENGVTPLMVASGIAWVEGVTFEWSVDANKEAIKLLLALGNQVNEQDREDHRTALMGAAHKGRPYAVQMLVDAGGDLSLHDIGSRDSLNKLTGATWTPIDYADGLVRVGVQSAEAHPETSRLIRSLMLAKGMQVPPEGRTLESICVVDICK
jgi:ankyrin repeat protein